MAGIILLLGAHEPEMTGTDATELKQKYLIGLRMGSEGSLETQDGWVGTSGKGQMPVSMLCALLIPISRTTGMGGTPSLPLPPLSLGSSSFLPPV